MKTYRYIWSLFRYAPGLYLGHLTLTSIVFSFPVLSGLVVREFLDRLSGHGVTGFSLWTLVALLLAVAAARWVPILFVGYLEAYHHHLMQGLLRHNLLRQILKRPGASPLAGSPGDVANRFRDDVEGADHIFVVLYDLVGHTVMTAVAVAVMASVNPTLTLLIFLPLVTVMLVAGRTRKRVESARRLAREATGRATASLNEIFGSAQAIVLAGAEERVVAHFEALSEERRRWTLKEKLLIQVLTFLFDNTVTFGTAMIFLAAARSVGTESFTVGDFALFTYYLQFMWEFVSDVGELVPKYKQVGVHFDRLAELLPGTPARALVEHHVIFGAGAAGVQAPARAEAVGVHADRLERLEVRGLTCLHPESGRGVAAVDLQLERGSFTVITGRVGSGKTTLLRALLGLLPAQSGQVSWNGALVADPGSFLVAPRCAYTSQAPLLFSTTLQENILLGLPAGAAALEQALTAAVLEEDVARMEQGLQTEVGARGVRLSGGQVQRTAAARMFVREPELLVVDDLSSALDAHTERQLWERLLGRPGATCLAVSHRREALRRADQILVLKDGRVEDRGRLEELLDRCEEMRRLWAADQWQPSVNF